MAEMDNGLEAVRFYVAGVMMGLLHLHSHEILCRMCSLDLVMLDSKGYPVLVDFTLSKKLTDCGGRTYTLCGIADYNAPEQVQKVGHGVEPDFWALGVLAFELLTGSTPWTITAEGHASLTELSDVQTYAAIMAYAKEDTGPVYPTRLKPKVSRDARDFIEDLLDPDPKQRLGCRGGGFDDIECHAWFDDFTWQNLEDATLEAPFSRMCHDTAREFFNAPAMASSDKKLEFDTLTYAGDNRWCDDWDYTCTVGVQVEETQEPAHHRNSVMKRRSSTTKPRASVSFTPDSTPRGGGAAAAAAVKEALGDMTEGPTKPVGRPAQLPVAGSGVAAVRAVQADASSTGEA